MGYKFDTKQGRANREDLVFTECSLREKYANMLKENPFLKLSDVITVIFRDEIIRMNLQPGFRINISEISETLSVSRTPVASAMDKLENEGLLQKAQGSNMLRVAPMDITNLILLCDARKTIEGGAAYLASQHITTTELDELKKYCNKYVEAVSSSDKSQRFKHAEIDDSFHLLIVSASRNTYLMQAYLLLRNQLLRYRYYIDTIENRAGVDDTLFVSANTHVAIYNALKLRLASTAKVEAERDSQNMHSIFSTLI